LNHLNHLGISVIPKTEKKARLAENFDWYNFKLTDDEYKKMNELNKNARFYDYLGFADSKEFPLLY